MGDQYPPYQPPSDPEPEPERPDDGGGSRDPRFDPYDPPLGAHDLAAMGFAPAHAGAFRAMSLGGASLFLAVFNLFCCFSGIISLVIGPIAVGTGLRARREIDADPGRYGNRSMAVSGIVTGALGTVVGALTTVFYLFYVGLAFNAGFVY
ncbi:DUF4190 domain-containing protein [Nocardioides sp. TF02-7]|uniref:DUF4190 domain-containing protein n=1 Tax=Nocardioides sp. TF02-7 TaxID=2917724 RepID=UPI001F0681AB|nr:DUF4190 domain-containing protein [Nocardioides sp. TF02-7]UMG93793.1 DUF4190 domain-containing protein [Nocardioides sp. TF02-7]